MSSEPLPSFTGAMAGHRAGAPSVPRADRRTRRFDEALRLMEDGCWPASFRRLAELADEGHPQAAHIALLFVKRGTSLFGGRFHASAEQRSQWQRVTACHREGKGADGPAIPAA